jgi:hypothetical protein
MYSYIDEQRNWSLVKLHGSVNWGRAVAAEPARVISQTMVEAFTLLGGTLEELIGREIELRPADNVAQVRLDPDSHLYYPAVSIPLGAEDELVCPEPHVNFLRRKLQRSDGLNLLVVGYSGLDREVLTLLRESGSPLKTLHVVSEARETAQLTGKRILEQFGLTSWAAPDYSPDGFGTWAQSGELDAYFERLESVP